MQSCWIDINNCPETFHEFHRTETGDLTAQHGNGEHCEVVEYNFKYHAPLRPEDLAEMGRLAKIKAEELKEINYGQCSVCRSDQIGKRHEHPCE